LGRIHPKKGLVNLLKAWAEIQRTEDIGQRAEWVLAIAGWDQGGHEAELKRLASELDLAWAERKAQSAERGTNRTSPSALGASRPISLLFTGPLFGPDKESAYVNCDAFILPSFSEGLPMAVLEAWAYGKPVLMTPECNLPEGFAANAALRIEPNAESMVQGLRELFQTPDSSLFALGARGRELVASRFAWPKIAADMKSVYEWVLGGGARPECIQTKN
jgi:poly(glycerol-phosphate) alpha-glucosyltransferase